MKIHKKVWMVAAAALISGFSPAASAQSFVETGTGTSASGYVPAYYLYDYGWSQVIYLQSEIGSAMELNGISYYVDNTPSNYEMLDQRIYLKHTSLTAFPDASYDDVGSTGFTQVYQGTVTWDGSGWQQISFDTPFPYNGTDNLIVYWQNHDAEYATSGPRFRYTSRSNRAKYKYGDDSFPAVSGSLRAYAANIRLHFVPAGPGEPSQPEPSDRALHVTLDAAPTLTWSNPAAAAFNAVYFSETESDVVNTSEAARVLFDGTTLYDAYQHPQALDPGKIYYWRVLEYDSGEVTPGPVWNFSTIAATVTNFPWSEDFEHGGCLPRFWTQEVVVATNSWIARTGGDWGNPPSAHGGTYNAVLIGDKVDWDDSEVRLITPPLDLSAGSAQLTFWHAQVEWSGSQDELRIFYRTASDGEWTLIPWAEFTTAASSWTKRIVNLPDASAHYQIAFHGYNNFGYGVCIDDVEIAFTDYPVPTNPRAESITQTGAVLRWDGGEAAAWSVEWGLAGFTPGAGTLETGLIDEELSLADLTQGTQYEFHVRSHYPEGDSNWNGPILFATAFSPVTVYPWTESFESDALPAGWTEEFVESDASWMFFENNGIDEDMPEAYDGDMYAVFGGYEEVTKLVTRELDLSALTAPQLSFWHAQRAWDDDQDELRVYYRQGTNGTWNLLPGAVYTEEVYDWTQRVFNLPSPSASYFIAFEGTGNYGYGTYIDLVRIEDTAYALPSELSLDALYSSSAEISWNGSALSYDVEWGAAGFGVGDGTRVTGITATAYAMTGLADNTEYEVYVRAVYADGVSGWAGPEYFDTFWGAVNAFPWLEDFERGYSVWDQWDFEFVVNERYWLLGDGGATDGENRYPPTAWSGSQNARFAPTTQSGSVTRLISRELDLSGLTHPELSFYHAQHSPGSRQDELRVLYRTGETGAWQPLPDAVFTNEIPDWQQRNLALPVTADSVFIGFEGAYHLAYGVCLDDVLVYDATCPVPTNLVVENVLGNSADIGWGGAADHWNIEWGLRGFAHGNGSRAEGIAAAPHTLPNLSGYAEYDAYAQAVCGVYTSAWAGPIQFTTEAGAINAFPWMDDFDPWREIFDLWTSEIVSGSEDWIAHNGGAVIGSESHPEDAYSGVGNVLLAGEPGNVARLISPEFDLSGMTWPRLRFQHAQRVYNSNQDELRVYYRHGSDGEWNLIEHGAYTSNMPDWTERTLYLPQPTSEYYLAFAGTAGWSYGVCVDDVILDDGPMPQPLNLRADSISHSSATLLWDGVGAPHWDVEWGPQGFAIGAGTRATGLDTNVCNLVGLAETNTYDFYVREDRGSEQSDWSGPATFTTTLAPNSAFPWIESFEHGGALPVGWQSLADTSSGKAWQFDIPGGPNTDPARYAADYDHTTGSGYVAWINDSLTYLQQPTMTLVTREIDLSGVDYPMLSFWYWIGTGTGSQWPSTIEVDVYDGSQWHSELRVVSESLEWQECTLDLTPFKSGATRVRFLGKPRRESITSDIALDDVGIMNWTNAPACTTLVSPADEQLQTPAAPILEWERAPHAGGYKLWIGTDNPPSNLHNGIDLGDATEYICNRLEFGTTYFWKIVPYNPGGGEPVDCPVWSFTTGTAQALPWANDFETDDGDFTHGSDKTDEWEWGTPNVEDGIQSGYGSSAKCWGTDLDYFIGPESLQWLKTGWFDLTSATAPELSFQHIAHASDDNAKCRCFVEISTDGHTWTSLPHTAYLGAGSYSSTRTYFNVKSYTYWDNQFWMGRAPADDWWRREKFSLAAWVGQPVQLRFSIDNRTSSNHGWFLDDIRIDEKHWWVQASAGADGSITPSGPVLIYHGGKTNFAITPDAYHHVAGVTVNGSGIGAVTAYLWSNATNDGTIHATFSPTLAAGGTPHKWLAEHDIIAGGVYSFDEAEQRVMGPHNFTAAQEFIADTNPNDPDDYFHIIGTSNGLPITLRFTSSSNRLYTLQGMANLIDGTWTNVPGSGPRAGIGGEDSMVDENEPRFGPYYRLKVDIP